MRTQPPGATHPRSSGAPSAIARAFGRVGIRSLCTCASTPRTTVPWHTMTTRDDHIWEEEVVEIFLDADGSGRNYAELEISPANVVCDLRVVSPWPSLISLTEWDWDGMTTEVVHTDARRTEAGRPWRGCRGRASGRSTLARGGPAAGAGRGLALQRLPHQAPGRPDPAAGRSGPGGLVEAGRAQLSRSGRVQAPAVPLSGRERTCRGHPSPDRLTTGGRCGRRRPSAILLFCLRPEGARREA